MSPDQIKSATEHPGSVVDQPLDSIYDNYTNTAYTYYCEAMPGSNLTDPVWRCSRYTIATGRTQWSSGYRAMTDKASERVNLTYLGS